MWTNAMLPQILAAARFSRRSNSIREKIFGPRSVRPRTEIPGGEKISPQLKASKKAEELVALPVGPWKTADLLCNEQGARRSAGKLFTSGLFRLDIYE